jgi:hypothetical protein
MTASITSKKQSTLQTLKEKLLYIFAVVTTAVTEFISTSVKNTKTAITETYTCVSNMISSPTQVRRDQMLNMQAGNFVTTIGIVNLICCFFVPLTWGGWLFNIFFSWAMIKTGTNTLRMI